MSITFFFYFDHFCWILSYSIFKFRVTEFLLSALLSYPSHQAWTLTWMYPWTWVAVVVVVELWATKSHPSPNWRNFGLLTLWSRTANLVKEELVFVQIQSCLCSDCLLETWSCTSGVWTTTNKVTQQYPRAVIELFILKKR